VKSKKVAKPSVIISAIIWITAYVVLLNLVPTDNDTPSAREVVLNFGKMFAMVYGMILVFCYANFGFKKFRTGLINLFQDRDGFEVIAGGLYLALTLAFPVLYVHVAISLAVDYHLLWSLGYLIATTGFTAYLRWASSTI